MSANEVAIVFGSMLLGVTIFCAAWIVGKIFGGGSKGPRGKAMAEEARLMQELNRGLVGMEQRVETLETILLDSKRKDGSS